jgi:TRAP transporter TAXI family solute receptor
MKKRLNGWIVLLSLLVALTFPGMAGAENITLASAAPGGSWYPMGVAMLKIWEKSIPGLTIAHKPGGGVANVMAIVKGLADVSISNSASVGDQIVGNAPFEKPSKEMRTLASFYPSIFVMTVWKDSGINHISQLKGKRIAPGKKGYTSETLTKSTLEAAGVTYKDLKKVEFVSDNNAVDLMKDGHIDCFSDVSSSLRDPSLVDLAVTRKVHILEIPDDIFKKLTARTPGLYREVVPKGTYNGIDQDVKVLSVRLGVLVSPKVSNDLAYKLTKALAENWVSEMHPVSNMLATVKPEKLAAEIGIELHPGAAKYYKEKGWLK